MGIETGPRPSSAKPDKTSGHPKKRGDFPMSVLPQSRFDEIQNEIAAETRPATKLEAWLATEIANAKWELERVRANTSNIAAESRLNDAYGRATRNWNRARKELQSVQTAHSNRFTKIPAFARAAAAEFPLADAARAPWPSHATAMADHLIDSVLTQAANEANQAFKSIMERK